MQRNWIFYAIIGILLSLLLYKEIQIFSISNYKEGFQQTSYQNQNIGKGASVNSLDPPLSKITSNTNDFSEPAEGKPSKPEKEEIVNKEKSSNKIAAENKEAQKAGEKEPKVSRGGKANMPLIDDPETIELPTNKDQNKNKNNDREQSPSANSKAKPQQSEIPKNSEKDLCNPEDKPAEVKKVINSEETKKAEKQQQKEKEPKIPESEKATKQIKSEEQKNNQEKNVNNNRQNNYVNFLLRQD